MIGKRAPRKPVLPVVGGPHQALVGILIGVRGLGSAPRQRYIAYVALFEQRARGRTAALETEPHITRQPKLNIYSGRLRESLVIDVICIAPASVSTPVIENGLAFDHCLNLARHAPNGSDQGV